jgi:hypothetical protein
MKALQVFREAHKFGTIIVISGSPAGLENPAAWYRDAF